MSHPLAKSVLTPLGLTTAASTADAGIHKKILSLGGSYDPRPIGLGMTTVITSEIMNGRN